PVADLPSHTFLTEISVDNPKNLKAGVYATVYLTGEPKHDVLTIPPYAIVMRDDQRTAYVVKDDGVVNRRVLSVGYMNDDVAEILTGLTENDRIVVGGQNKLREGSKIVLKDKRKTEEGK
ncbi:MAG: efflux transporter periplasmic adaptor subunit, partial [Phascolarctobacterium sp.]|nr:efflux transporter periplasmic adaptor subunit [Candidatus Phascolarctobacterium equi]